MSKLGQEILEGLREAVAFADGEVTGARVTVVEIPDVRAIRENLHLSQSQFADTYKIPLLTLQSWEQRKRNPDRTATAYLSVIARLPKETAAALQS